MIAQHNTHSNHSIIVFQRFHIHLCSSKWYYHQLIVIRDIDIIRILPSKHDQSGELYYEMDWPMDVYPKQ